MVQFAVEAIYSQRLLKREKQKGKHKRETQERKGKKGISEAALSPSRNFTE